MINICFYLIYNYYNLILFILILNFCKNNVESIKIDRRLCFITNYRILDNLPNNFRNKQLNRYKILKSYEEDGSEVCVLPNKSNDNVNCKVSITNNQKEFEINEGLLLEVSKIYKSKLGLDDFRLDIFIEDEDNMRKVNKNQFGKDKPTDIISLREDVQYTKSDYIKNKTPFNDPDHYHMGEIFLCPKYIKHMAETEISNESKSAEEVIRSLYEGGVAVRMEGILDVNTRLCFLLAHGILHLIGYDHVKDEEYVEMTKMEDVLLDEYMNFLIGNYDKNMNYNDMVDVKDTIDTKSNG